eukprot:CAMPEP_0197831170 /NCGR_PEP_ID=MMETSP1437-20131217/7785_1 /TAXON_ID=49252 ORGANISM="Eucampia antarctica, Strain CCMP1452" /NCGR_SAMPLE_ID=MMETSP1437 /ASSEMBLY_ACC=CAM_ASM_001096 /LENGTH=85 /DNA_ID=CAMNT_0043433963 /DNA_START=107 /DNA_END=364 /DNA_ORIENTATION=+
MAERITYIVELENPWKESLGRLEEYTAKSATLTRLPDDLEKNGVVFVEGDDEHPGEGDLKSLPYVKSVEQDYEMHTLKGGKRFQM